MSELPGDQRQRRVVALLVEVVEAQHGQAGAGGEGDLPEPEGPAEQDDAGGYGGWELTGHQCEASTRAGRPRRVGRWYRASHLNYAACSIRLLAHRRRESPWHVTQLPRPAARPAARGPDRRDRRPRPSARARGRGRGRARRPRRRRAAHPARPRSARSTPGADRRGHGLGGRRRCSSEPQAQPAGRAPASTRSTTASAPRSPTSSRSPPTTVDRPASRRCRDRGRCRSWAARPAAALRPG